MEKVTTYSPVMDYLLERCVEWSVDDQIVDFISHNPDYNTIQFSEPVYASVFNLDLKQDMELRKMGCTSFVVGERVNVVSAKVVDRILNEIL